MADKEREETKEEERLRIHLKECKKHGCGQLDADEYYTETPY